MTLTVRKAFRLAGSVYLLYWIAFGYLVLLISFSQTDVFYSGDGGLKFMMIKQICAGEDFRYIAHTQPGWVEDIWAQGFFPIRKPFVFPGPKGYFFVFAPPFEIVNAFFYKQFGYRGLYIIPSLSLLVFWYWFIWLARKMDLSGRQVAPLFFLLAFCSPLTLYGAIYWEHTLGILLLFSGIVMIMYPPQHPWQGVVLGCLGGAAVWVRPEALLLNILFAGAVFVLYYKEMTGVHWLYFTGLLLATTGFLLFNKQEYGYFFGIHGWQALGNNEYFSKYRRAGGNIYSMNLRLLRYFPIIVLLIPVLFAWLKRRWPLDRRTAALLLIAFVYWAFAPLLFPNDGGKQWGPRFFLPLIPMTLLVCAAAWRQWKRVHRPRYKLALYPVVFPLICYGFFLNTFKGARILREDDLNRIRPALEYVRKDPGNIVVVNSQFITMELSSIFREKYFFLVDDTTGLHKLIPMMENRGADHFVYVNYGWGIQDGFDAFFLSHHTKLRYKGSYLIGSVALDTPPVAGK